MNPSSRRTAITVATLAGVQAWVSPALAGRPIDRTPAEIISGFAEDTVSVDITVSGTSHHLRSGNRIWELQRPVMIGDRTVIGYLHSYDEHGSFLGVREILASGELGLRHPVIRNTDINTSRS